MMLKNWYSGGGDPQVRKQMSRKGGWVKKQYNFLKNHYTDEHVQGLLFYMYLVPLQVNMNNIFVFVHSYTLKGKAILAIILLFSIAPLSV